MWGDDICPNCRATAGVFIAMTLHDYLRNLSTGCSRQDQQHAIFTLANELGQPRRLVMPPEGMSCWRNAALTLQLMGRPYLDPALPDMMGWLKDMSWPGAEEIRRLLLHTVPRGNLAELMEHAAKQAVSLQDRQWITNLASLISPAGLTSGDFRDAELTRLLLQEDQTANR